MIPTDYILLAYKGGYHLNILNGRQLTDIVIDSEGKLLILNEMLRQEGLHRGFIQLEYSKAEGIIYDLNGLTPKETDEVNKLLSKYGIINNNRSNQNSSENEFSSIIRGIIRLVQTSSFPKFENGMPMKFLIIIKYGEDLMPNLQTGTHTDDQLIAIELCTILSKSLALPKNGSLIFIKEEREGSLDKLLLKNIPVIRIPQPDEDETSKVLEVMKKKYPIAKYEPNMDDKIIINSSKNSPNRVLHNIFVKSFRSNCLITLKELYVEKQSDIITRSEGTLEPVDYDRIKDLKLVGRMIERVIFILEKILNSIKRGEPTLTNVLLAGPPGTGKTDTAIWAAQNAGVLACNVNSPKSSLVGESERKIKVLINLKKELGGVFYYDEIEKIMPMDANKTNLDSGVSDHLMGALQCFWSDSSLAGRVLSIANTNNPHKISVAMGERWEILPCLMALKEDLPAIILSKLQAGNQLSGILESNEELREAAFTFYSKGINIRKIQRMCLGRSMITGKKIELEDLKLLSKAANQISEIQSKTIILGDLLAIKYNNNEAHLPWVDPVTLQPDLSFPFPDHIQGILNADASINQNKLDKMINELMPYANA